MKTKTFLKSLPAVLVCAAFLAAIVSGCENELLEDQASSRLAELQANNIEVQATRRITSAADMAQIGSTWPMSDDYILVADIVLSAWTPIGTEKTPFTGTFNGTDPEEGITHTITVANFSDEALVGSYLGIFGYVGTSTTDPSPGYIHDLNVQVRTNHYAAKAPSSQYVGALVGWADTGVNLTNIKVVGEIDYANPSNLYLGGIAGYLNGASLVNGSSTAATNVNIGAISIRTNYTGGAVGYGANATITGVFSIGPITIVDGAVNTSAGGVSGYTTGTTITDCHATGNISVSLQRSAMIYVGGLAGYARSGLITKSHATGNVTALTNYPYAGGLVGYNYDGNVISESYATGNVTSSGNTSTDDSYPYAGGLAGYNSSGSVAENPITTIINCYSTGDVTAQGAGDTAWAGGITGSNAYNAVISKTYATGSVTARTPHDPTSEAPNTGAIAGGIVGYNYFGAPVVEYSFALNSTITNYGRTNTYIKRHRIEGSRNDSASLISNMGSTDMVFDPAYSPPTPADPDGPDGGNTVAQPAQGDYVALGWIFTTSSTTGIWKMNTTISPYPLLQWQ